MIGMKNVIENSHDHLNMLKILGVGLVTLSSKELNNSFKVFLQKGIGRSLIQNIIELYKEEILLKLNGKSFFPLEEFMVFINYFKSLTEEILIIIYIDEKESAHIYPQLYLHSKKIVNIYNETHDIEEIKKMCELSVEIPRVDGIVGLFIVDYGGCPLYSKVMGIREDIIDGEVQVGGFISALFSFSQFVIGKESGGKLREINFGNQSFYTIAEKKVIFAYLIEKMTPLLKRYMYIIAEEFVGRYSKVLNNFDGDIAQFSNFENIINEYLII